MKVVPVTMCCGDGKTYKTYVSVDKVDYFYEVNAYGDGKSALAVGGVGLIVKETVDELYKLFGAYERVCL